MFYVVGERINTSRKKVQEAGRLLTEEHIDAKFARAQHEYPVLRSKEEVYYYPILTQYFGAKHAVETVGQWVCL